MMFEMNQSHKQTENKVQITKDFSRLYIKQPWHFHRITTKQKYTKFSEFIKILEDFF